MWAWKSHRGPNVLVWHHSAGTVWSGQGMARLSLLWKSLKIYLWKSKFRCMSSDCLYTECRPSSLLLCSVNLPVVLLVTWVNQEFSCFPLSNEEELCWPFDSLQERTISRNLEHFAWRWIHSGLQERHCHHMLWWCETSGLSLDIHIFCWLPWEVRRCWCICSLDSSNRFSSLEWLSPWFRTKADAHAPGVWLQHLTSNVLVGWTISLCEPSMPADISKLRSHQQGMQSINMVQQLRAMPSRHCWKNSHLYQLL